MGIFKNYTGNAMLNNALMTVESLGKLNSVQDITADVLRKLYKETDILKLNKRLKSYTMLFTKNGPLHNDKAKGDLVYENLMQNLVDQYMDEGDLICEISGIRFSKTFSQVYADALKKIGLTDKEISSKDTGINRNWYPLIGGLGSDAQALPQGKFAVQIHPICVFIMQFLPLSAFIYNRGILVIDSSNTEMVRKIIADHQIELWKRIKATSSSEAIENVKDYSKGHYILQALKFLVEKEFYEESYSDLNLWSFSNSGTGASCEIDRVPNTVVRKLLDIAQDAGLEQELNSILINSNSQYSFLEALEGNNEWWLLYPAVFGSGKKEVRYAGVSVKFLEVYFKQIGKEHFIAYAKYIAGLIQEYKSKHFEKYLIEVSAWNNPEYKSDLYAVFIAAAQNGKWALVNHIQLLDDTSELPIKNRYYKVQKLIHYYYQKQHFSSDIPIISEGGCVGLVSQSVRWVIGLIQDDERAVRTIEELGSRQKYQNVGYSEMLIRAAISSSIKLEDIASVFFTDTLQLSQFGLNELLHIFYNQREVEEFPFQKLNLSVTNTSIDYLREWFNHITDFACDYQTYYYTKYKHRATGKVPVEKFKKLIANISLETSSFMIWLREAIANTNEFIQVDKALKSERWKEEELVYSPYGDLPYSFSKLAIKFIMTQQTRYEIIENQVN